VSARLPAESHASEGAPSSPSPWGKQALLARGITFHRPEIAEQAIPDDERVWVPQAPDVSFRPLLLNTVSGAGATCCACAARACCRGTGIRWSSPAT
jgi:hypothetical protein